jgi:hypothetical protein
MKLAPEIEATLFTLYVDGLAIAVCAIESKRIEGDAEGALSDALFETWRFGGGDPVQLIGRNIQARPPTRGERNDWHDAADASGKPYLVFNTVMVWREARSVSTRP